MVNLNFLGFGAQQTTHGSAKPNIVSGNGNAAEDPVIGGSHIGFLPMFMNLLMGAVKAGQKNTVSIEGEQVNASNGAPEQTAMNVSLARNVYFKKITVPEKITGEETDEQHSTEESPSDECETLNHTTEIIRRDEVSLLGLLATVAPGEKTHTVENENSETSGKSSISHVGSEGIGNKGIVQSALAEIIPLQSTETKGAAIADTEKKENDKSVPEKIEKISGFTNPETLTSADDVPKHDAFREVSVKPAEAGKQFNEGNKVQTGNGSQKIELRAKDDTAVPKIDQNSKSPVPPAVHNAEGTASEKRPGENIKKVSLDTPPPKRLSQTETPNIHPASDSSSNRNSEQSLKDENGKIVDQSPSKKGTDAAPVGIRFDEFVATVKNEKGPVPAASVVRQELHAGIKNNEAASLVIDQLSKHISLSVQEKSSEVKLILQPESLGEVTLRVKVEEGKVTTHMEVQQPQVKTVIESGIPALRESLESKGLTVGTIEVFSTQYSLNDKSAQHHQSRYPSKSPRRHGDVDEVFEQGKMLGYNTVEYIM